LGVVIQHAFAFVRRVCGIQVLVGLAPTSRKVGSLLKNP
jgi:hypothetical protein